MLNTFNTFTFKKCFQLKYVDQTGLLSLRYDLNATLYGKAVSNSYILKRYLCCIKVILYILVLVLSSLIKLHYIYFTNNRIPIRPRVEQIKRETISFLQGQLSRRKGNLNIFSGVLQSIKYFQGFIRGLYRGPISQGNRVCLASFQ